MTIEQLYEIYLAHPCVSTDSRRVERGSIFFALKGERFDGNQYALGALEAGAAYAVVDDPTLDGSGIICVPNVLRALQDLARHHRRALGTPLIAITGTNGKTTTKELTAAVLARTYRLLYTEGNLNNHIGVPLTLLRLRAEHQLALIEMGASKPGDIAELCGIAEPNYGLITNVGLAHLEGFGSLEGVIRTKGELYDWLRDHEGKVFRRQEDEVLSRIGEGIDSVTYGCEASAVVWGSLRHEDDSLFLHFTWQSDTLSIPKQSQATKLVGGYNLANALGAICVGGYFDVPVEEIVEALANYTPSNSRSQLVRTERNELIVDAYNANPSSMQTAIGNLLQIQTNRPRLLVLGDMNELGAESQDAHHALRIWLQGQLKSSDVVVYCGPKWQAEVGEEGRAFASVELLRQWLEQAHLSGYLALIKGSNSIALGRVLDLL